MGRIVIYPGEPLMTKVGHGISIVRVKRVKQNAVEYQWPDGATGWVEKDEIGTLGNTEQDWQFVRFRPDV